MNKRTEGSKNKKNNKKISKGLAYYGSESIKVNIGNTKDRYNRQCIWILYYFLIILSLPAFSKSCLKTPMLWHSFLVVFNSISCVVTQKLSNPKLYIISKSSLFTWKFGNFWVMFSGKVISSVVLMITHEVLVTAATSRIKATTPQSTLNLKKCFRSFEIILKFYEMYTVYFWLFAFSILVKEIYDCIIII